MTAGPPIGTGPGWRASRAVVVPVQLTTPVYVVHEPPPPAPSGRGRIVAVVVGALLAMCCIGGATLAYVAHTSKRGSTFGALPRLNDPVLDRTFEFVVASMSCGHASVNRDYQSRSAHGQFCLVALTVRNTGPTAQPFVDSFQKAIGPSGEVYRTDPAARALVDGAGTSLFAQINPGNTVSGTLVFDIPAVARIATLELHEYPYTHGAIIQVV